MPHQCVKCGTFYPDKSPEVITGCTRCHGKLFFYVKKAKADLLAEQTQRALTKEERASIETDVYDLIGHEVNQNKPIILDLETIRMQKPGTYELDLVQLFHEHAPVIYKLEEGKYLVDLAATFEKLRKK